MKSDRNVFNLYIIYISIACACVDMNKKLPAIEISGDQRDNRVNTGTRLVIDKK